MPSSRRDRSAAIPRAALTGALIGILALASLASVAVVVVTNARQSAQVLRQAALFTPPVLATPSAAPLPVIAIIGDGAVNQSARGVGAGERWPARIAASQQVRTSLFADARAGYVEAGSDGRTFGDQAARIPTDATLVIFVGGANDVDDASLPLIRAATDAIATAKKRAPSASIFLVGPLVTGEATADDLTRVSNVLQNAAGIVNATWVDPIGQKWLQGTVRIGGTSLSAADERAISGRLETLVQAKLNGDD